MATLYTGTSGWAYTSWKPKFYPAKLAAAKFLQHYATRLNTVEVNYTFRRFVTEKTLENWINSTPGNFKFSIKAHQGITHIRRLKDAAEQTRAFLDSLQPLAAADKLGMVLFQLPPFLKADTALLEAFLGGLPRSRRFAFEFRHPSWFDEKIFTTLRNFNAAVCVAESEKLETPEVTTADFSYYRLRKPDYSPQELQQIGARSSEHLRQERNVFVYFKHEESPEGAMYAEQLLSSTFPSA